MTESLAAKRPAPASQVDGLREVLRQIERSGTARRALLLHIDRLPPGLAKPQHQRLARAALSGMANADRAQFFELSRGRLAIVWRARPGPELDDTMAALELLIADLPPEQAIPLGQLISVFDLPEQAAWLADELVERPAAPVAGAEPGRILDAPMVARLEQSLAQADLARFIRWRAVVRLDRRAGEMAWEMRYVSARDIAAGLCPDRAIKGEPWLFRRLTRSFDRRMLSFLADPQDLRSKGPFALHMNVGTILSAEFLRFDAALPASLRGEVVLNLSAPDIVADAASFTFARKFARSRGYRLLLRGAGPALLGLIDVAAASFDYVDVPLSPAVMADPDMLRLMLPAGMGVVLSGVDSSLDLEWARAQGFAMARGRGCGNG